MQDRPKMATDQIAHYAQLRTIGHTAERAIGAARAMIGAADARRGPRPPYTDFSKR